MAPRFVPHLSAVHAQWLMLHLKPVFHGIVLGIVAMLAGILWAAYILTHEAEQRLHFEQVAVAAQTKMQRRGPLHATMQTWAATPMPDTRPAASSAHQLAATAMQRLRRAHVHFMGLGMLAIVLLQLAAASPAKTGWKQALGWGLGLGALAYPLAWILTGYRTAELGAQAAEASVRWLLGSSGMLLCRLLAHSFCCCSRCFVLPGAMRG